MPYAVYIFFLFLLGACVGSFLNVVVWRLPRVQLPVGSGPIRDFLACMAALSDPPSHCPQCNLRLKWYDNIPILGWIKLGGRCRFCRKPFSVRYPIVELVTGLLFAGYFVAFYVLQWRNCCPQPRVIATTYDAMGMAHELTMSAWVLGQSWPIYLLYMVLVSALLAATLIDAELYIIPVQIPWVVAVLAVVVHTIVDTPTLPGALNLVGNYGPTWLALAIGSTLGFVVTLVLWSRGIIPTSFPDGEPVLEVDLANMKIELDRAKKAGETTDYALPPVYTAGQIRREIAKEMLFLTPPLLSGGLFVALAMLVPPVKQLLARADQFDWFTGLCGSLLGAMTGAFVVWIVRILGTLVFRKVAMGLGDVHLMFGVGAVIGAGGATVAFFVAPFFGILIAVYSLFARRGREIPFGPFLSMATAAVLLCYCPVAAYLKPGLEGLFIVLSGAMHGE